MPFHRFEEIEKKAVTPHLSSGQGAIIEGEYMYFCQVSKVAGTGSQIHYHPNELMIFPIRGKINALVGKDRRVVSPGAFVHVPAYAQHQMIATEDGDMDYLYVKDRSWTVVGLDRDQVVPDKALTVDEINQRYEDGTAADVERDAEKAQIIVEGLKNSYYPLIPSFDAPECSGRHTVWIEGERLAFGYGEIPEGFEGATVPRTRTNNSSTSSREKSTRRWTMIGKRRVPAPSSTSPRDRSKTSPRKAAGMRATHRCGPCRNSRRC